MSVQAVFQSVAAPTFVDALHYIEKGFLDGLAFRYDFNVVFPRHECEVVREWDCVICRRWHFYNFSPKLCEFLAHQFAVDEFGLDEWALTEYFCKRVGRVGRYLEQDFRDVLGLAHLRGCLWD